MYQHMCAVIDGFKAYLVKERRWNDILASIPESVRSVCTLLSCNCINSTKNSFVCVCVYVYDDTGTSIKIPSSCSCFDLSIFSISFSFFRVSHITRLMKISQNKTSLIISHDTC